MSTLTLPSPAKINLFLHITGQREDGYHLLQTLFTFLDYCDTLTFTLAAEIELEAPKHLGAIEDNLIYRAAHLLREHTGYNGGAYITVSKRIPAGAGLGGGSSNAATTLIGLNHLWGTGLSQEELKQLAVQLGADVPVFIHGETAFAEGIGEQLHSTHIEEKSYIVVTPAVFVSTQTIFQHKGLTRNSPLIKLAPLFEGEQQPTLRNDCEAVVTSIYPEVKAALDFLKEHVGVSHMSGTGSAVFAPVASLEKGARILTQLPQGWTSFVARSCNTSPLITAMQQLR
ncbi:MAG TPA: 4-(cytidine 5'-diphospho)-2-C-methyl-D-erythritol kinase [Alcanivoracaceae bacterium]|nr:4-(cytidine 5'-diphospho)-2-C-methyl-D-erythritol kinase [Alcanivoracaceae bacterium]